MTSGKQYSLLIHKCVCNIKSERTKIKHKLDKKQEDMVLCQAGVVQTNRINEDQYPH